MKLTFVALLCFFFVDNFATAQDEGAEMAKKAGEFVSSNKLDRIKQQITQAPQNADVQAIALDEAKQMITQALQNADVQAIASAWITKGDIYDIISQKEMLALELDPNAKLSVDNNALIAFNAYKKGFELATQQNENSDALDGFIYVQRSLAIIGLYKFKDAEYDKAYLSFAAALQCHDLLSANGKKSVLDDKAQFHNQLYITALSALMAKRNADALPLFEILYKAGTDKAGVYEGLYKLKADMGDASGAQMILDEGRKKFPEDSGLLFTEINLYLKSGKLNELVGRLKQALQQEPENVSLYVNLGIVYHNLYQIELQAKNDAKAGEYFEEAKKYYVQATEKDPKSSDSFYSLGALYYNKAALRTQELNSLPDDFTAAGIEKNDAMKKEIMVLLDQALPNFQKAESANPNDLNTLIPLQEIYELKEDETMTMEFKKRLEIVKSGGKNAGSYFRN